MGRRNYLTDLKDMTELLKEAAPNIFREGFSKKAKERFEELKVLKSRKQAPKRTTNWRNKDFQFFQGHRSYAQARRCIQRPQQTVFQAKALPGKAQTTPHNRSNCWAHSVQLGSDNKRCMGGEWVRTRP